jgi:thiol-disulfide isomerase/thioredoxin
MPSYYDIIGNKLIDNNNQTYDLKETTNNKYFALYFSAKWCGPCRNFTPKLIDFYNKSENFEVIFVSLDKNENEFNEYFSKMPWKSLPFDNQQSEELSEFFGVQGIPTLILVDHEGNVLTRQGKEIIEKNSNLFQLIIQNKYNYSLVEKTLQLVKGQGDGRISDSDVNVLIEILKNKKININDYKTIFYILHNFRFTDPAIDKFLSYLE